MIPFSEVNPFSCHNDDMVPAFACKVRGIVNPTQGEARTASRTDTSGFLILSRVASSGWSFSKGLQLEKGCDVSGMCPDLYGVRERIMLNMSS